MPVVRLEPVGALAQTFQRVLPDGLEQPEARFTAAGLHPHQAVVHQRAQRVYHLPATVRIRRGNVVGGAADGLHGGQAERASEHPEPGEQRLLAGRQQAETPVQSAPERPLPLRQVTRPAGQQTQPVAQPRKQRLRGQQLHPGGREFDGQRQPVQPTADLGDGFGVLAGQLESRGRGTRPLHEQAYRGVLQQACSVPSGR